MRKLSIDRMGRSAFFLTLFLLLLGISVKGQNPFLNPSFENTSSVSKSCQGSCNFPDNWNFNDCNPEGALCEKTQFTDGSLGVGISWTGNTGCCTVTADLWQDNVDLSGICEIAIDQIGPSGGNPHRSNHYLYIDGVQVKNCGFVNNSDTNTCYLDVSGYTGTHQFMVQWNQRTGDNLGNSAVDHVRVTSSIGSAPSGANASPTTICSGENSTLTVNGGSPGVGAAWEWYSGSCGGTAVGTGSSITVNPSSTTTYYVRAEGGCDTTSCASVTLNVQSNSTAPSSASASPDSVCSGNSSNLSRSGGSLGSGASYEWYSGSCGGTSEGSGSNISVTPSSTTTYYVRAEGNCDTTACQNVTVTVNTPSSAPTSASASPNPICPGNNTTLSQSGGSLGTGATYEWYSGSCGGTSVGSGSSITVSPSSTTTYYVRAEGTCNTTSCVSVTVNTSTTSSAPSGASASPNPVCPGDSTTLNSSGGTLGGGADHVWYSGSCGGTYEGTGASIKVAPTVQTTYFVRIEGGCDTTICQNVTVDIKTVSSAPTGASASPDTICPGSSTSLMQSGGSLSSGASYEWYSGSCGGTPVGSGAGIVVSPSTTTTYYVRAEGSCDTTSCANTTVVVQAESTAPNSSSASPNPLCPGDSATLTQGGGSLGAGASYEWYTGSCGGTYVGTGSSIKVAPTNTTTYYVRAEGTCNTTTCDQVTLNVNPAPTAPNSIYMSKHRICQGDSVLLERSGGSLGTNATFEWYSGSCGGTPLGNGNKITVSPSTTTAYFVRVEGDCDTTACAGDTLIVDPLPTVDAGSDLITCDNAPQTIGGSPTASGATAPYQYDWSPTTGMDSSDIANPEVLPDVNTTYYVDVMDSNGCKSSDSMDVFLLESPEVDAGGVIKTCVAEPAVLGGNPTVQSGVGFYYFSWTNGETLDHDSVPNPTASPEDTTTYILTVTDSNNCQDKDTAEVLIADRHCADVHVFVPNAFSPNGDHVNDELHVRGKGIESFTLVIYNRWGEKVFSTSSRDNGWDGTHRGKALDPGVFVYHIAGHYVTGETFEQKGNITLLK